MSSIDSKLDKILELQLKSIAKLSGAQDFPSSMQSPLEDHHPDTPTVPFEVPKEDATGGGDSESYTREAR